MSGSLARRLGAEGLGSTVLTGVVVGSGILASRLAAGNDAIALLGNTAATGAILFVLITGLAPISGAHFNPAVTMVMWLRRALPAGDASLYIATQIAGCILGAWLAHAMFELPILQTSQNVRAGFSLALSEGVATFTLVVTILGVSQFRPASTPAAVALAITAGYWWTASTSFANPAITIARSLSNTFSGVRPADAPAFILAQFLGALLAWTVCAMLLPRKDAA